MYPISLRFVAKMSTNFRVVLLQSINISNSKEAYALFFRIQYKNTCPIFAFLRA